MRARRRALTPVARSSRVPCPTRPALRPRPLRPDGRRRRPHRRPRRPPVRTRLRPGRRRHLRSARAAGDPHGLRREGDQRAVLPLHRRTGGLGGLVRGPRCGAGRAVRQHPGQRPGDPGRGEGRAGQPRRLRHGPRLAPGPQPGRGQGTEGRRGRHRHQPGDRRPRRARRGRPDRRQERGAADGDRPRRRHRLLRPHRRRLRRPRHLASSALRPARRAARGRPAPGHGRRPHPGGRCRRHRRRAGHRHPRRRQGDHLRCVPRLHRRVEHHGAHQGLPVRHLRSSSAPSSPSGPCSASRRSPC